MAMDPRAAAICADLDRLSAAAHTETERAVNELRTANAAMDQAKAAIREARRIAFPEAGQFGPVEREAV